MLLQVLLAFALIGPAEFPLTPDLLTVAALMGAFLAGLRVIDKPGVLTGVVFGLTGVALYWAKGIGFFLFPLLGLAVVLMLGKRVANHVSAVAASIGVWVVGCLPPLIAFTRQNGMFTISSAGNETISINGPDLNLHGWLFFKPDLYIPTNDRYTSMWTEPSLHWPTTWSPFDSLGSFDTYLRGVMNNLLTETVILGEFGVAVSLGLAVLALWAVFGRRDRPAPLTGEVPDESTAIARRAFGLQVWLVLIGLLVAHGLTYPEKRYLLVIVPAALVALAVVAGWAGQRFGQRAGVLVVLVSIVVTMGVVGPRKVTGPSDPNPGLIQAIEQAVPPGSRVVGTDPGAILNAAYYGDFQFVGALIAGQAPSVEELRAAGVGYAVVFGSATAWQELIDEGMELTKLKTVYGKSVRIYEVTPK
jgi:hypothetical protein